GIGVGAAKCVGALRDKMLIGLAVHVTPKRNAILRRAKSEAVEITSQVGAVARKDVCLVPMRTEGETRRHTRIGIKLRFIEQDKSIRFDERSIGDAVLHRVCEIIVDKPSADVRA